MRFRAFVIVAGMILGTAAHSAEFTYEDLVSIVKNKSITTIDTLLPELPESLRGGYTLMKKSRSQQEASFQNPRAILFGENGKLTCAFNGDASQDGYDLLECIQFREKEKAFDLRQIEFPSKLNGLTGPRFSERNRSADGKISCLGCHGGADPRPNWNEYPNWPGAYGEDDTSLGSDATAYAEYEKTRDSHPRYRWLIQEKTKGAPFEGGGLFARPNLVFGDLIGRMNGRRAGRLFQAKSNEWQSLGFAFRALECTPNADQIKKLKISRADYLKLTDLEVLFKQTEIPSRSFKTVTLDDNSKNQASYEHQSGFTYLSDSTAMAIVMDRIEAGDDVLRVGVEKIIASPDNRSGAADLLQFQRLNQILPDPDHFSTVSNRSTNLTYICPRLVDLFAEAFVNANLQ